MLQTMTEFR